MSEEEQTSVDQTPIQESQEAKEPEVNNEEQDWGDDITEDKDGGLFKKILTPGQGNVHPLDGDEVSVHYTGRLLNGEVFDSSVDRGEYFKFKLGEGQVIKGWDKGVATMTRGEKCILTCKPEYGYGESGSPPKIPPNATLRFEVELFDWSGEDVTGNAFYCTGVQQASVALEFAVLHIWFQRARNVCTSVAVHKFHRVHKFVMKFEHK